MISFVENSFFNRNGKKYFLSPCHTLTSWSYKFSSAYFLAHLSRRLTGELIPVVYPCSGVCHCCCHHCCPQCSNIFSSEITGPINAKLQDKTKIYINGPGHMTKVATMPIYGKNHEKSSSLELVDLLRSFKDSSPA